METSAVDFVALTLAVMVALAITVSLALAHRGDGNRRAWIAAVTLIAVLIAVGLADLLRETPRQTHIAAALLGASLPVLGALGMLLATRTLRPIWRGLLTFAAAFFLLLGGVLLGAAVLPRYLP
jgi:UDP-N-acetylmuramyl pentapeptide phosphotransferase/UDP-N-acetylglucosamine-1-phosphate transferase